MFVDGMVNAAKENGIAMTSNRVGGMFGLFFSEEKDITNFEQVSRCNIEQFNQFFHGMLAQGINLAPSAYEAGFMSAAHTEQDIEETIASAVLCFLNINES